MTLTTPLIILKYDLNRLKKNTLTQTTNKCARMAAVLPVKGEEIDSLTPPFLLLPSWHRYFYNNN
jgi:hypothetical protein